MQDWREALVDGLQIIAPTAAALFALLGLFTEYKKDGKVTRYGRLAVVGIVLSALCSLLTQWAQGGLDEERSEMAALQAAAQLRTEDVRFNRQIKLIGQQTLALGDLNTESLEIRDRLRLSLIQLGLLQTNAAHSLGATLRLENEQRASTARVLRTMWADANRITPASIQLAIGIDCGPVLGELPVVFPEGSLATIGVARPIDQPAWAAKSKLFASKLTMTGEFVALASFQATIATQRKATGDGANVYQAIVFQSFKSDGLGEFAEPEQWDGAYLDVVIVGFAPGVVAAALEAMPDYERGGKETLRETYDISKIEANDDYGVSVLPCEATGSVFVNQREVASLTGKVVQVWEGDEDVSGKVVLKFPVVQVIATAFPRFDAVR